MTTVLHVLDHSLPEQSGYSFRSHSILRELTRRGIGIDALTSPKQGAVTRDYDEIDGVRYQRTRIDAPASTSGVLGQVRTVVSTRRHVSRHLRDATVDVVHAHSPCLNGLAAIGHGKPLVYEMRSSWEDAAVSVGTTTEGSLRYRASRALETFVAERANEVVVICEGLKTDLISRGIPERKITVVPNALSPETFILGDATRSVEVRARYGLRQAQVIGFFGSFFEWEGIALLVEAMPEVIRAIPRAKLLLAGGGRQESRLRELARATGVDEYVIFAGRIAHDDVLAFYRAADVMAYPRLRDRLTDLVTPLKPLEAMAQRVPVVASDVGGHREQIDDGKTGFLFPAGDRAALARRLVDVLNGAVDVEGVVSAARAKVERDCRWDVVAERYVSVYERLVAKRSSGNGPGAA